MAEIESIHQEPAQLRVLPDQVRRACSTAAGPAHAHNEDACSLPPVGADEARLGLLLAVADGVGGLPGGALASREAVDYLQALYYAASGPEQLADRLSACFEMVNAINRQSRSHPGVQEGRLTTLVAAVVLGDQIWVANVGDSRAYLLLAEDGQRQQLTEDHSERNRWVKSGLTNRLLVNGHASGGITRAIGLEEHCQVDTYQYTWAPGDRLVLCSDGLAELNEEEMAGLALGAPVEDAVENLVARAIEKDGSDNCTVIVAAWEAQPAEANQPRDGKVRFGQEADLFGLATQPAVAPGDEPRTQASQEPGTGSAAEDDGFHFVEPVTRQRPRTLSQFPSPAPRGHMFLAGRDAFFLTAGLLLGLAIALILAFLFFIG